MNHWLYMATFYLGSDEKRHTLWPPIMIQGSDNHTAAVSFLLKTVREDTTYKNILADANKKLHLKNITGVRFSDYTRLDENEQAKLRSMFKQIAGQDIHY